MSHGTISLLPQPVVEQVIDSLHAVAHSSPITRRRLEASFELAFALISGLDQRELNGGQRLGLNMLLQAANLGMEEARAIVDSMHAAFGLSIPVDHDHPNREIEWLSHATSTADLIAQRRLKQINEAEYTRAMEKRRHIYCGVGVEIRTEQGGVDVLLQTYKECIEDGIHDLVDLAGGLRLAATAGDLDLITLILGLPDQDINARDSWGDTALNMACRSGHWDVALYLINHGADVTMASHENVTALHWLPSFPEEKINEATDILVSKGAVIEARSHGASRVYGGGTRQWHRQGGRDGTPLLWAVVSSSIVAVKALLRHGADPWDRAGSMLITSNNWGKLTNYSPVDYAAEYQMKEILQELLDEVPDHIDVKKSPLNMYFRPFGTGSLGRFISPLAWAVSGASSRPFELILLHGKGLESAVYETIRLLLRKGADPRKVDSKGSSVASIATIGGNINPIQVLYRLGDESCRLDEESVLDTLKWAVTRERRAIFDFVKHHHHGIIYDNFQSILDIVVCMAGNPYFIESMMEGFSTTPHIDHGRLLWLAIEHGNFRLALSLHKKVPFDPQYAVDGMTTLGSLIRRVKSFGLLVQALEFTFSLFDPCTNGNKDGFWTKFNHPIIPTESNGNYHDQQAKEWTKISLLHLAAWQNEFRPHQTNSTRMLDILLRYYNHPHQINAIVPGTGWTALHFAVASGNTSAVRTLIEESDIDLSIQDYMKKTPMDIAWTRFCGPKEIFRILEILPTEQPSAQKLFRNNTEEIVRLLRQKRAKWNLCCGIIRRESEGEADLILIPPEMEKVITVSIDLTDGKWWSLLLASDLTA
jgi:ankyrin repeat protein